MSLIQLATPGGEVIPTPLSKEILLCESLNQNCEFNPRDGVKLISFPVNGVNALNLLGGWNSSDTPITKNEHWVSFDNGASWALFDNYPWNFGRHTFVGEIINENIWVMLNDPYNPQDKSVWKFNGYDWIYWGDLPIEDNQSLYFSFKHIDENGKEWVYFGGGQQLIVEPFNFNNYLHRFDGETLEFVCYLPEGMGARSNSVAWSYEGCIFIAGGGEYKYSGEHTYNSSCWISRNDGLTWNYYKSNSLFERQYANVTKWNNRVFYLDGNNRFLNGNVRGLYEMTISLDEIFKPVNGWGIIPQRHASGFSEHTDKNLHVVAGNLWNDSYQVKKYKI